MTIGNFRRQGSSKNGRNAWSQRSCLSIGSRKITANHDVGLPWLGQILHYHQMGRAGILHRLFHRVADSLIGHGFIRRSLQ